MGYIKLNRLSQGLWRANCVYSSEIDNIWIICLVKVLLQIVSKKLKYVKFLNLNFLETICITHFTRQMIQILSISLL